MSRQLKKAPSPVATATRPHGLRAPSTRRPRAAVRPGPCYVGSDVDDGVGYVVVSRRAGLRGGRSDRPGVLQVAVFLVDAWCVGVKDAYLRTVEEAALPDLMDSLHPQAREVDPAFAVKLVLGAVRYAGGLGLHPHPAYRQASTVLHGVEVSGCATEFTFGKDGKPLFVESPGVSSARAREVLAILTARLGSDGFNWMTVARDESEEED